MWSTQQTISSITLLHNRAFRSFESGANSLISTSNLTELWNRMLSCLQRLIQGIVLVYVPTCLCLASGGAWWGCFDRNCWKSMRTSCRRESHCLFQLYDYIRVNEWYKHGNFFHMYLPFCLFGQNTERWGLECSKHSERMIEILLDKVWYECFSFYSTSEVFIQPNDAREFFFSSVNWILQKYNSWFDS